MSTPILSLTCLALAVACLAGVNLYLTAFLLGAAVRMEWLDGAAAGGLAALGHPAVLAATFVMALAEAVVDRIPWVDSLWDSVHTLIRPAGAAALAWMALGPAGPGWQTAGCVAAGILGLASHLTKSGIRLVINLSPEPFTNFLASTAEDVAVVILLLLTVRMPATGLAGCLAGLAATWIAVPAVFRIARNSVVLLWKRIRGGGTPGESGHALLPRHLTAEEKGLLAERTGTGDVLWSVPCIAGRARGIAGLRAHATGVLAAPAGEPAALYFLTSRRFRRRAVRISLAGAGIHQETSFLSINVVIRDPGAGRMAVFRFPHPEAALAGAIAGDLLERTGTSAPRSSMPPNPPSPEPDDAAGRPHPGFV